MFYRPFLFGLLTLSSGVNGLRYHPEYEDWNLNTNQFATEPVEYSGKWENHAFHTSPENWRFPFYTIFLDRFVNGDPSNDNINGTSFEVDILSNQLRSGGDVTGLQDSLDYLQGMGIQGLYLAGSPHINQPWSADSFSPLDLTMLDWHFGNITAWRELIKDCHARGMYVVLDNTISTMGDLIGFEGYLNTSTPFSFKEHKAVWKGDRQYLDFDLNEGVLEDCVYPRFWDEHGQRVGSNVTDLMTSCKLSDFDQYGDVASFGEYPEWQKQLSKFGFVQDRLREWQPSVMDKIARFSCLTIQMLDIDGFRIDKALTITLDAQADWSKRMRECAAEVGKKNFFITGEIVAGNALAALYIGRGKEPQMSFRSENDAFLADNTSDHSLSIREVSAMESATFHYSVYRSLTRFLGIDGIYGAEMDIAINWADGWKDILKTNDMVNTNTGKFDPLHLYGTTNQDVFRWPGIKNGTQKNLLGLYVTTMLMPGIPILMWGEEQAMYVLENTAANYIFGRQPMSSTLAWQLHGCYRVGSEKYFEFPFDSSLYGCEDWNVSLDHRDPSHPVRNAIKRMYEIRRQYPVVNDGFMMEQLSTQTHWIYLPGSGGTGTELGLWSSVRRRQPDLQDFSGQGAGNEMVWLLFSNENQTKRFTFDCESIEAVNKTLVAPFEGGTVVKNLFYPYEEYTLDAGAIQNNYENSTGKSGCLRSIELPAWGFKALVRKEAFLTPAPTITRFLPGHDYRLQSRVGPNDKESVMIEIHFSVEMNCNSVRDSISLCSETHDGSVPELNKATIKCTALPTIDNPEYSGETAGLWKFVGNLDGLANGIHRISVSNATSRDGIPTSSTDHFLLRVGQEDNPMVFPRQANYSTSLITKIGDRVVVNHRAAGASMFRLSRDYQSSWTDWLPYDGNRPYEPAPRNWTGTKRQDWKEEHIVVQYWSKLAGSSHHQQEGDLIEGNVEDFPPRRFPHVFINGLFNQFGFDSGMSNQMSLNRSGFWEFDFMAEWPTNFQFNIWGMNPDGQPDKTWIYGDINKDFVLDRIPPGSLLVNVVNITEFPKPPFTAWRIVLDDRNLKYFLLPSGSSALQLVLFVLLWLAPLAIAVAVVYTFIKSYYQVKFNEIGVEEKGGALIPLALRNKVKRISSDGREKFRSLGMSAGSSTNSPPFASVAALQADAGDPSRRTVLIATMEYDIEDWKIKIKIGGLGVMAQLMGKNLGHQDLIWVVPCVGGIDYPIDHIAEPMYVTILGKDYKIDVQYHKLRNITYVLLDAPLFRQQTKNDPYPARMDDLDSAILYSAWNSCIAEAIRRFPVDIYHINDYHGALAPLHLLPDIIPCCLSLHNAEFQGLWPMRTEKEKDEVCKVFNIDPETAAKYVQFGEVFNLLHAGASYLRVHQKGFGAVGVSKKYGKRSYARYPIFWGLSKIRSLPNPDPSDTAEWNRNEMSGPVVAIDREFEANRAELRRQAQEWAGLEEKADAELFVFVGRWSMQKGVDLIADVFPSILENYPNTQLITIGPVIDLYGRFAALKLEKLTKLYPGRVFSRPEFTQLPPYIFSGAEFALIPSRDEPFGLVAVEFGRKGALGVGSRVGGLGQMPGWWFTIESNATKHMIKQFKTAIHDALASTQETRAMMRARSAKQRFPVAQWVEDLSKLQSTSIRMSREHQNKLKSTSMRHLFPSRTGSRVGSPNASQLDVSSPFQPSPGQNSALISAPPSPLLTPRLPFSESPSPRMSLSNASPFGELLPPPVSDRGLSIYGAGTAEQKRERRLSNLSIHSVVGERTDFALQQVDPFFTDANGVYSREFEKKLETLGPKNSESELCIEEILTKNEKRWFDDYRGAKLGQSSRNTSMASLHKGLKKPISGLESSGASIRSVSRNSQLRGNDSFFQNYSDDEFDDTMSTTSSYKDEFELGENYIPPTGLRRFMLRKLFDWPVYSFILAFGQIIAANSYQITLLTGEVGQSATTLYVIASLYAITSVMWWFGFRRLKSLWVLSTPFVLYGGAFMFVGIAPFVGPASRGGFQKAASAFYTTASSSGSIYFALNFGDEGGAPVKTWVLRACIIQGTQQIYVSALWFWGSALTRLSDTGIETKTAVPAGVIAGVCLPVAVFLFALAVVTFMGLPRYYHQAPGAVPSFYKSIYRRKIILWFFVAVIIHNFWLAAQYGRNWRFLWTSNSASGWQILILVLFFFIGVWSFSLYILGRLTKAHSWILPIFAIGLGAPRWCQMLWGTSGIGSYLPWTASPVASALLSRSLWLYLGVLDALQGVGFGMILLQTMTRFHNTFTLIAAQFFGSIATIIGRAIAPNNVGPGPVFPNFALGAGGLANGWFWSCLLMQISICVGFALFFRKEQLSKP